MITVDYLQDCLALPNRINNCVGLVCEEVITQYIPCDYHDAIVFKFEGEKYIKIALESLSGFSYENFQIFKGQKFKKLHTRFEQDKTSFWRILTNPIQHIGLVEYTPWLVFEFENQYFEFTNPFIPEENSCSSKYLDKIN